MGMHESERSAHGLDHENESGNALRHGSALAETDRESKEALAAAEEDDDDEDPEGRSRSSD